MDIAITLLLLLATLAGCASQQLTPAQRLADVLACETAIAAAGIPLATAITNKDSANSQKAAEAKVALDQANALPACAKVGANAAVVVNENIAARKAQQGEKKP